MKNQFELGNSANGNIGNENTGNGNSGSRNSGDRNSGTRNTGDSNFGTRNSGDRNIGNGNSGDSNFGDGNTGTGNATNFSSGFFCQKEPTVRCFDVDTGLVRAEFQEKYPEWSYLCANLFSKSLSWDRVKNLPGITKGKLESLVRKHNIGRQPID